MSHLFSGFRSDLLHKRLLNRVRNCHEFSTAKNFSTFIINFRDSTFFWPFSRFPLKAQLSLKSPLNIFFYLRSQAISLGKDRKKFGKMRYFLVETKRREEASIDFFPFLSERVGKKPQVGSLCNCNYRMVKAFKFCRHFCNASDLWRSNICIVIKISCETSLLRNDFLANSLSNLGSRCIWKWIGEWLSLRELRCCGELLKRAIWLNSLTGIW